MSDENSNGNGDGSSGNGHDFGDREEPTAVIVSRDFLIGSLGRVATSLFGAGGVCLNARAMVTAGASDVAVQELIEELRDLQQVVGGMVRALERLEFKEEL